MSYLVLVRHGLSDYNKRGVWTGWDNPPLSPEGFEEAKASGETLKDIRFDYGYTSMLLRCIQSMEEIKKALGQNDLPVISDKALNERNYGDFTGKNKWEIKEKLGEEEFLKLRRGWEYPIPNGESLKQVYEREIPYFESEILPKIKGNRNVIIVSSGNALRAIIKYLENIPDNDIAKLEIATGETYVYQINKEGRVVSKKIRAANKNLGKQ